MINISDDYHLWSEKYDREMEDIFAFQDEISLSIVEALKVKFLRREKEAVVKHYTEDLEAYNLYLMGRYFWNSRLEDAIKKAFDYFNQAIEKDPLYTLLML